MFSKILRLTMFYCVVQTHAQPVSTATTRSVLDLAHPARAARNLAIKKSSTIEDRVMMIVSKQLGVKIGEISPESSFVKDLALDELDKVEVIMAVEEEFNVEIPDDEGEVITTVQSAIDYLTSELSLAAAKL